MLPRHCLLSYFPRLPNSHHNVHHRLKCLQLCLVQPLTMLPPLLGWPPYLPPFMSQFKDPSLCAAAKSLQSCPTLCNPRDGSPAGSPVPGILQARSLEWVAISFSNAWKWKVKGKSLSYVRLSDPTDHSLLGSSIYGIFQARLSMRMWLTFF